MKELHEKLEKFDDEFEAMINVAGLNYPAITKKNVDDHPYKISSTECFDKYE